MLIVFSRNLICGKIANTPTRVSKNAARFLGTRMIAFLVFCLVALNSSNANPVFPCTNFNPISGATCFSCTPTGWNSTTAQGTPDLIQGNGAHPFGSAYIMSDINGISRDGGAMGLFLDSNASSNEGWSTTLSGLSAGEVYSIALEWQGATLLYNAPGGVTYTLTGGGLEITIDGISRTFTKSVGASSDSWEVATMSFLARGSTATVAIDILDNSGTGTTTSTSNAAWGNGGAVVIDAGSVCALTLCDLNDIAADCDGDGVPNGIDCDPSDPLETTDIDRDGVCDGRDLDNDNDGILDGEECPIVGATPTALPGALQWNKDGFEFFIMDNNRDGSGSSESGIERSMVFSGYEVSVANNTWAVSGNVATFPGGTLTLDGGGWNAGIGINRTTTNVYKSGTSGSSIRVTPGGPVSAGSSFELDFDFDNPVAYFSFDWLDIFDIGNSSSTEVLAYSIYADGQLIVEMKSRIIGANEVDEVGMYDAAGVLRGVITLGHNRESTIGFLADTPVSTVTLRCETFNDLSARDFQGIDRVVFSGAIVCDPDNDGIPNHLDLNSDGDACVDAIEGGNLFRGTTASSDIENDTLVGGVDADGVPLSVNGTGQNMGDSQDGATESEECDCYEADRFDVFDEPTNIGLSDIENTWSVSWGDFNNDGFADLFTTNYEIDEPNALYQNNGDGTFSKVNSSPISTDLASSLASSWGDYNNDGLLDLYVANNVGFVNFLYRNEGGGVFTRVQNDPAVNDKGYAHSTSWVDYDNDGFLDIFVADFFATRFNQLYRNNGDGTFSQDTESAPTLEATSSVSGAWGDYNNDGLPDLFVSNTNLDDNSLYKNTGNGRFERITTGAIVNDGGQSVGASWGDYDNDGDLDLFVANAGNQSNFLYTNNGDETFTKVSAGAIVNDGGHSHGSAWADYDNDGDLDLYVANDSGNDNFLYQNNGDGTFTNTNNGITQSGGNSFGSAWADYDNDGDLDLYVTNHDDNANFMYDNVNGTCQAYSCINLIGTNSNASAIGAKIRIKATINGQSVWQMREISAQTGGGVGGQGELRTIFGLGNATTIDSISVEWPSGFRQTQVNQPVDDCLTIKEADGSEVCGSVYFDENGNCTKDRDEAALPNIELLIQPGNISVYTDENGDYSLDLGIGTYTIAQATGTNWTPSCPTGLVEQTVVVANIGDQYCGIEFGATTSCASPDLKVGVSPAVHRIGFENMIAISYENTGGETATDVQLTVTFDQSISPLEASIPWDSEAGEDRLWDLGTLEIGAVGTIYIIDSVLISAVLGSDLSVVANISSAESDCDLVDNTMQDLSPAIGALDPNDIQVSPEGFVGEEEVLTYKIRFQNVGNTLVRQVVIEDQLPESLDLSTIQLGSASDPFRFSMSDDGLLTWTFDNILLPDSTTNELLSHGYLTYRIKLKSGLRPGTRIENKAAIFFDGNLPVITNTVENIVSGVESELIKDGVLIYPNPVVDEARIMLKPELGQQPEKMYSIRIFNSTGQKIMEVYDMDDVNYYFSADNNVPGVYSVLIKDINGKDYAKKLIILK